MAGLYLLRAGGFVAGSVAASYLYYVTIVQRVRDDHAANMARIEAMESRLFKAATECDTAVQKAFGLGKNIVSPLPQQPRPVAEASVASQ